MTAVRDEDPVPRLRIALAKISRYIDRQVIGSDLTRTEMAVLGSVIRLGEVGAGELADVEGMNPTMLSRVVGKLEAAGYLSRRPDPDDRRAVRIVATATGKQRHAKVRRERTRIFSQYLAELPEDERAALLAALPALELLSENLRRVVRPTEFV